MVPARSLTRDYRRARAVKTKASRGKSKSAWRVLMASQGSLLPSFIRGNIVVGTKVSLAGGDALLTPEECAFLIPDR